MDDGAAGERGFLSSGTGFYHFGQRNYRLKCSRSRIGKFITSVTMTVLSDFIYYIWRERYQIRDVRHLPVYVVLACLRIGLCLLPQGRVAYPYHSLCLTGYEISIYVNKGIIFYVIFMFLKAGKKSGSGVRFMPLAAELALVSAVVLFSGAPVPAMGMWWFKDTTTRLDDLDGGQALQRRNNNRAYIGSGGDEMEKRYADQPYSCGSCHGIRCVLGSLQKFNGFTGKIIYLSCIHIIFCWECFSLILMLLEKFPVFRRGEENWNNIHDSLSTWFEYVTALGFLLRGPDTGMEFFRTQQRYGASLARAFPSCGPYYARNQHDSVVMNRKRS